ncbi:MAG: GNAT family N-acetyltransferase [Burkholderiales bacterium]
MPRVELMDWETARALAAPIRMQVFVEEQRVPADIELDEHDAQSIHAIAYDARGGAIATGRLLLDGHIGRMAVLKQWRGRGVGGSLLEKLIDRARQRGDGVVVLSAQTHALAFYRSHGFVEEGEAYAEAGIMHQQMRRTLR